MLGVEKEFSWGIVCNFKLLEENSEDRSLITIK